jgi:antitoxin VapB
MLMSLNLKDEETVALVTEVARRLGTTKTAAVRQLARERLDELDRSDEAAIDRRVREITSWLEREVWPQTAGKKPLTKEEKEDLLGYDEMFER